MPGYVKGSAADPDQDRRFERSRIEQILTQDLALAGGGDEYTVAPIVAGIVHSYLTEQNTFAFDFVLSVGGDAVAELLLKLAND